MKKRRFAKRGMARGALLATLVAAVICAACIVDAALQDNIRCTRSANLRDKQSSQPSALETVRPSANARNEASRSRADEMCWRTNSPPARRVIGYGELADGTNVVVFAPREERQQSSPAKSSRQSVRNCYQSSEIRAADSSTPSWRFSSRRPHVAENGSYYGQVSTNTGRAKTVHVRGYYRKDGTYVRGHYRSPPRR